MSYFDSPSPTGLYAFQLHRYYATHQRLCFRMQHVEPAEDIHLCYLYFSMTLHFSGSPWWVGKEFYTGSKNDLLSYCDKYESLKAVRIVYEDMEEDSLRFYKLYVFPHKTDVFYVVAGGCNITETEPQ